MLAKTIAVVTVMTTGLLAGELPLTVTRVVTGPQSRVSLTNTASLPVTAWSVATSTEEGGRIHNEMHTADGYLSEITAGLPGASSRLNRIMPGETRELPFDPLPVDAKVRVAAVVLEDGTTAGDEQAIASIFEHRAKERDALHAVVDAFNAVLPNLKGKEALAALRERLAAAVQLYPEVPCRAAVDAVGAWSQRAAAGGSSDEIDQSLRQYAAFVTREYELAVKHSRRRA